MRIGIESNPYYMIDVEGNLEGVLSIIPFLLREFSDAEGLQISNMS